MVVSNDVVCISCVDDMVWFGDGFQQLAEAREKALHSSLIQSNRTRAVSDHSGSYRQELK